MSKISSAKCYQENIESLQKIFLKQKKKQQYGCECYKNVLEHEKQELVEYREKYYRIRKNVSL